MTETQADLARKHLESMQYVPPAYVILTKYGWVDFHGGLWRPAEFYDFPLFGGAI